MGEAQRQNQGRCVTKDGRGRGEDEADHREDDSRAYIEHKCDRPTRTVWHLRPEWATRNVDGWQTTFSEFLGGRPAWTHAPLKDFRAQRLRHQQPARRTPLRHVHPSTGLLYSPFDTPRKSLDHHPFRKDGLGHKLPLWGPEQAWESIGLDIFRPRPVREGEVKSAKEECPAGLTRAQPLGRTDVLQILVIHPDQEGLRWPLQPVMPLAQGQSYRQQLLIANVIVTFCRAETTREKCTRVHLPVAEWALRKDCANPDIRPRQRTGTQDLEPTEQEQRQNGTLKRQRLPAHPGSTWRPPWWRLTPWVVQRSGKGLEHWKDQTEEPDTRSVPRGCWTPSSTHPPPECIPDGRRCGGLIWWRPELPATIQKQKTLEVGGTCSLQ